jgi:hypothetical protein
MGLPRTSKTPSGSRHSAPAAREALSHTDEQLVRVATERDVLERIVTAAHRRRGGRECVRRRQQSVGSAPSAHVTEVSLNHVTPETGVSHGNPSVTLMNCTQGADARQPAAASRSQI